ncbi:1-acyl-sn-glycerol-3-phosphate acyltransferase [Labrys miyagiensis]|uniref:1-acyl-sn-glycerol-3-phosphate acyltransferase n=1 Tax=Labrys miyagiensis TaxID=346912 RepID=A0ABQ6CT10_9HYPH|nr:lysophospholipid acyltransferase family protein [Labrys miyagiensis]GLS23255.1 1-acyl-sn-glycerol-3-phosphate acyltransferase [Labrys miyagiensis]
MRLKALCRIVAVGLLALPLIPLQWLAVRWNWRLARGLPVFFHRCVLAIIGVKVAVTGREARERPLLIVANHVSWLDIVVLGSLAPLSFIAKSEVAGWPVIGLFARLQRSIFIERDRRHKTGEVTAAIAARLRAGDAMLLFGEGTTSDGIHILPFRSALLGAAREAMGGGDTPAFVQPLALRYVRRGGLPIGRGAMKEVAWIGDVDLAPHLIGVLSGPPIDVVVNWGEALAYDTATDRKVLTRKLEGDVRALARSVDPAPLARRRG